MLMDTNGHTILSEDYVSFEVAKLLKEKGFREPCYMYYDNNGDISGKYINPDIPFNYSSVPYYLCPSQSMAMKWLREEKNIFIVIEPHAYDYVNEKNKSYACSLWIGDNYYEYLESRDYPSYEETVEAALKYCLKNLI